MSSSVTGSGASAVKPPSGGGPPCVHGVASGSGSAGPPRGACSNSVQHSRSPFSGTDPGFGSLPWPMPPVSASRAISG